MNYTKNNLSEGDYNKLYIWVNNTEWTDIEKHVEIINKYTYNKKYLIEQHNSKKCIYPILIKLNKNTHLIDLLKQIKNIQKGGFNFAKFAQKAQKQLKSSGQQFAKKAKEQIRSTGRQMMDQGNLYAQQVANQAKEQIRSTGIQMLDQGNLYAQQVANQAKEQIRSTGNKIMQYAPVQSIQQMQPMQQMQPIQPMQPVSITDEVQESITVPTHLMSNVPSHISIQNTASDETVQITETPNNPVDSLLDFMANVGKSILRY